MCSQPLQLFSKSKIISKENVKYKEHPTSAMRETLQCPPLTLGLEPEPFLLAPEVHHDLAPGQLLASPPPAPLQGHSRLGAGTRSGEAWPALISLRLRGTSPALSSA